MGRTIPEWPLVAIDDPALLIDGQPFGRNAFNGSRWPLLAFGKPQPSPRLRWGTGDVAAQSFQLRSLVNLTDCARMQTETVHAGQ